MDSIEAIVVGSFTRAGDVFATELKVMDVSTKKLLKTSSAQGEGIASILKFQIDDLSKKISRIVGLSEQKIDVLQKPIAEVTTNSTEAYNYFIRGREEFDRLYWTEATKFLLRAVELDSTFATAFLYLAGAHLSNGEITASNEAYENAMRYSEKAVEKERWYIEALHALRIEGDPEKYAEILTMIVHRYPKEKRAHYGLGEYYRRVGTYDLAIDAFAKTLQLDPNFGPALNYLAYTYVKIGDLEKALEYAKQYAAVNPADANPFDTMGDIYVEMGDYTTALVKHKEALDVKPDFGTDYKVGYIYALQEDYEQALKWAKQGVLNAPTEERILIAGLWVHFFQYWTGSMEKCLQGLRAIEKSDIVSDGVRATAYWLEAWVHYDKGELAASKQAFENSLNFQDFTVPGTIGKGLVELQKGNITSARSRLVEVESLFTAVPVVHTDWTHFVYDILRTELMLIQDSVANALEIVRNIRPVILFPQHWTSSLYQNTPYDKDLLARAYYAKGDTPKAIAEYQRLTTFDPKRKDRHLIHPTWHYELGRLYEEIGEKQKAIAEYKTFLKLYKNADKTLPILQKAQQHLAALTSN
jgi:tetratricopeptide (TPR) repeat protein